MLSQLRTHIQSWWQQTPLPTTTATPKFQQWHVFDQERWIPFIDANQTPPPGTKHQWSGSFRLTTWNINADTTHPKSRISALVNVVQTTGATDILFLQEVSRDAFTALVENPWVQQNWYTSDIHASAFRTQKFMSMTLVSRPWVASAGIQLGAIWRAALPSHFGRDALCCDMILNKHSPANSSLRIRLINVHLDSLPISPSLRPQQLAICTLYLRAAGRGVIAGDFNPVLAEDEGLVETNGLVDARALLNPHDPGYTWGMHGEQVFPPNRMDKVAVLGLVPLAVGVFQTKEVGGMGSGSQVQFSDHLGVGCEVGWEEDRVRQE